MKDVVSKLWNKDITNLTTAEITDLLTNIFYQVLLVQVTSVNFGVKSDETGTHVKFIIDGEAYKDETSLDPSDEFDILEKDGMENEDD
jgi:hypothetical protein